MSMNGEYRQFRAILQDELTLVLQIETSHVTHWVYTWTHVLRAGLAVTSEDVTSSNMAAG